MRIGIFGGSFNPPHKAHKAIIKAAIRQHKLDRLYVMPTAKPPHKSNKEYVSAHHRSRMCRLMIESMDDKRVLFSDYEIEKGGVSYTYQTLETWKEDHPKDKLFFIIGGDSLETFPTWIKPERISELATILCAPRSDMTDNELNEQCKRMSVEYSGDFYPLKLKDDYSDISSSAIREKTAGLFTNDDSTEKKTKPFGDVPAGLNKSVWRYIRLHGLYGCPALVFDRTPNEKLLLKCLKATLRPKRYIHTLGVADTAERLGEIYSEGDDDMAERARLAGLLHDCAKYYSDEEQISLCDTYGIGLTQTERENPSLIHGKLGAYLAENRYGVSDDEILSSIALHTVGKPAMTTLEKIIYIADYIEPGRVIPDAKHPLKVIRQEVMYDLDGALTDVIENTIEYLKKTDKVIDEASQATLEFYTDN